MNWFTFRNSNGYFRSVNLDQIKMITFNQDNSISLYNTLDVEGLSYEVTHPEDVEYLRKIMSGQYNGQILGE